MVLNKVGVVAALFVMSIGVHAQAAEWWVDQAAAAGGDGSQAKPFSTINAAKAVLKMGDTLWIKNGTYKETVDFWQLPAGTGGRTVIRAAPGASPVIDGGGASGFVLQAGQTPDMTFRGLTVENGDTGIEFYKADGGEVIDCTTKSTGGSVAFYFASHGHVSGSKLEGSVSGKNSDGTIIENNEIYGSGAEGITLHADSKNCRYSHNIVHDNTSVNIYLDSISHSVVDSNLVYMSAGTLKTTVGIMLADEAYPNVTAPVLSDITITNNVVIHNESGIRFWDGDFKGQSALKNVVIANNTVVDNKTTAIKWDAGPHQNTFVENNIFAGQSGQQALLLQANSTTGITLDHNLWNLPGVQKPFLWANTTYSHSGWASATGQGAGDVSGDPAFSGTWDLPATNLELAKGSPAIDKGKTLSNVTHDYNGAARPAGTGYDIGAFEYGATAPAGGAGGTTGSAGATGAGGSSTGGTAAGGAGNSGSGGSPAGGAAGAAGSGARASAGDSGGCGCRLASGQRSASAWLLALLVVVAGRRRRR